MRTPKHSARSVPILWVNRLKASFIGVFGAITTLAISPYKGDEYNFPKLVSLAVFAFVALIFLLPQLKRLPQFKALLLLVSAFICGLVLVLIFSGAPISEQIMGSTGRNTGFIAYLSLAIILFTSAIYSSQDVLRTTLVFFIVTGAFSTIYAMAQRFNADPFPTFTIYRPIISFLGNPDFQSAFSALTLICAVGLFFLEGASKYLRIFLVIFIEVTIFVILETHALQGIITSAVGVIVFFGIRIFKDPIYFGYRKMYAVIATSLVLVSLAGSLSHGPLAAILYKDSVASRGDFWRAGIKMASENPIFGVGLDNYRSYFMQFRDSRTLAHNFGERADAAHNVFIDFAANGGLIAFLTYSALIIYTLYAAYKVLRNSSGFDPLFASTLAIWIGYIAQSTVSINQLGIAVWGWIFSGLIIGYSIKN